MYIRCGFESSTIVSTAAQSARPGQTASGERTRSQFDVFVPLFRLCFCVCADLQKHRYMSIIAIKLIKSTRKGARGPRLRARAHFERDGPAECDVRVR